MLYTGIIVKKKTEEKIFFNDIVRKKRVKVYLKMIL